MLCDAIAAAVRAESAVIDGEAVCLDDDGRPNLRALLFRRAESVLYAFDLLALDGRDLRGRPLLKRNFGGSSVLRSPVLKTAASNPTCRSERRMCGKCGYPI